MQFDIQVPALDGRNLPETSTITLSDQSHLLGRFPDVVALLKYEWVTDVVKHDHETLCRGMNPGAHAERFGGRRYGRWSALSREQLLKLREAVDAFLGDA